MRRSSASGMPSRCEALARVTNLGTLLIMLPPFLHNGSRLVFDRFLRRSQNVCALRVVHLLESSRSLRWPTSVSVLFGVRCGYGGRGPVHGGGLTFPEDNITLWQRIS